jgi:small-conductance mechanosensitive channel
MNLNDTVFAGIRLYSVLTAAGIALAAAIFNVVLRWWLTRRSAAVEAPGADAAVAARLRWWLSRGVHAVLPPTGLIVWIHGLYAICDLLLTETTVTMLVLRGRPALAWLYGAAMVAALVWLLSRIGGVIEQFLTSLSGHTDNTWDDVMLPLAGSAARRLLPLLALILAAPALAVSASLETMFRNGASLMLIGVVAFILFQAVDAAAALVLRQHRTDVTDNLQARAIHTQVMVLRKLAVAVIVIFTIASMLMVFESVRQFGASILASAGIAGIIIGFAAQKSIATLLAGFQIALTQPIRVDDVVIVEGEWGRIEDITLTYVVVRIWDQRRLVVPITYFIEQPFQNWTRTSADILGTVFLQVDYTVPVDELRAELTRILQSSKYWDGKVNGLVVTDVKERTLEVRALASAADASLAWDLRCEVREKLVDFVRRTHPASLPRLRGAFETTAIGAA